MATKIVEEVAQQTTYKCTKCGYKVKAKKETNTEKGEAAASATRCYDSHSTLDSSCKVYSSTYGPFGRYPKEVQLKFNYTSGNSSTVALVTYKIATVDEATSTSG